MRAMAAHWPTLCQAEVDYVDVGRPHVEKADRVGSDRDHGTSIRASGDFDIGGECCRCDSEAADIQQILVADRAWDKIRDDVLTKSALESEDVIATASRQRIVPGSADDRVIASSSHDAVGAGAACQTIGTGTTDERVVADVAEEAMAGTIAGQFYACGRINPELSTSVPAAST